MESGTRETSRRNLEYGDPGETDVVEGDGAAVRIAESGLADGVVLVPVNTGRRGRGTERRAGVRSVTRDSVLGPARDIRGAMRHPVITFHATDEIDAAWSDVGIRQGRPEQEHWKQS